MFVYRKIKTKTGVLAVAPSGVCREVQILTDDTGGTPRPHTRTRVHDAITQIENNVVYVYRQEFTYFLRAGTVHRYASDMQ